MELEAQIQVSDWNLQNIVKKLDEFTKGEWVTIPYAEDKKT